MSVVVKNGNIVTPTGVFRASVFVSDGKITGLGEGVRDRGAEVIDADGMYVFPGFVDEHVHFREPGLEVKEDFETGSKSAVAGGVTTVLEMPNTIPPVSDVKELRRKDSIVRGKAFSDYGLYGVLTDYSLDDLEELFDAAAVGFKAFLGPTTGDIAPPSDATVYKALEKSAAKGFPIAFHCENRQLVEYFEKLARERGEHPLVHLYSRPAVCEVDSVRRVVYLAQKTGGRALIVHISSGETVSFLEREHLPNVFTETCPQYLFFDSRDYERLGTLIKVNPPIRGPDDREMLWEGIRRGVIKTLGSDHAPHTLEEKNTGMLKSPSGMLGVETLASLMIDAAVRNLIPFEKVAEICSTNPAKAFNLYPRKGSIVVGADADLVIVDTKTPKEIKAHRLHSKNKFTPYDGMQLNSSIKYTILRGHIVAVDGEPTGVRVGRNVSDKI